MKHPSNQGAETMSELTTPKQYKKAAAYRGVAIKAARLAADAADAYLRASAAFLKVVETSDVDCVAAAHAAATAADVCAINAGDAADVHYGATARTADYYRAAAAATEEPKQ
jgi:3'-phosphoadenosine 5'-phosphosulfate (PAPS) 3'-phosphatase